MDHTQSTGAMNTGPQRTQLHFEVNGQARAVDIEPRTTLLDVLRDQFDLTGAKRACDRGECGACTVLVDGQPMYAYLLAIQVRGRKIVNRRVGRTGRFSTVTRGICRQRCRAMWLLHPGIRRRGICGVAAVSGRRCATAALGVGGPHLPLQCLREHRGRGKHCRPSALVPMGA